MIIVAIAMVAALNVGIMAFGNWLPPFTAPRIKRQHAAITALVNELRKETLEQSVARLQSNDLDLFPKIHSAMKGYQSDLEMMLGHRRYQKILHELDLLPKEERAARQREIFNELLDKYAAAFEASILHAENPASPANQQSLYGTQLGLAAILWSTASSGDLELLVSQLDDLEQRKSRLQDRLDRSTADAKFLQLFSIQYYEMPDSRVCLNVQLLALDKAMSPHADEAKRLCNQLPAQTIDWVAWDAFVCTFDEAHLRGGVPVDTSRGFTPITLYNWSNPFDREEQEALIDQVNQLVRKSISDP